MAVEEPMGSVVDSFKPHHVIVPDAPAGAFFYPNDFVPLEISSTELSQMIISIEPGDPVEFALRAVEKTNLVVDQQQVGYIRGELQTLISNMPNAASNTRKTDLERALQRHNLVEHALRQAKEEYDQNYFTTDTNGRSVRNVDKLMELFDTTDRFENSPALGVLTKMREFTRGQAEVDRVTATHLVRLVLAQISDQ